jgi:16S rRNA (adenine1518-N6/adenine1519-N6)-dimethyltransferase
MLKKKSLGQNFLKSKGAIAKMVEVSGSKKDDMVLEIGPGLGVLTEAILLTGANVVSVEKDDRLIPVLQKKFEKEILTGQFILIHSDILEMEIKNLKNYKLIANIPYYITGQIIRKFLESENQPSSMTLLVQKEVAERIVAKDGKESLLSLSVKVYGQPKYVQTVKRGSFDPAPNVDSAIIHISDISRKNFNEIDEQKFFLLLHAAFAHKRKQLLPNLSNIFDKEKITKSLEKINLSLKSRAEDIAIEKWIGLSKLLY